MGLQNFEVMMTLSLFNLPIARQVFQTARNQGSIKVVNAAVYCPEDHGCGRQLSGAKGDVTHLQTGFAYATIALYPGAVCESVAVSAWSLGTDEIAVKAAAAFRKSLRFISNTPVCGKVAA